MISYAQTFEDVMLNRVFGARTDGFYVDVGAADPTELSVTKWFYDQGWSGINIEPHPVFFQKLQAERPRDINLNCAAGAEIDTAELYELSLQELSTLDAALQKAFEPSFPLVAKRLVQIMPLTKILERHAAGRHVDFLKIDTEGWEYQVLQGLDLGRFRPTVILLEAIDPNTKARNSANSNQLLRDAGYLHVYFDGLNEFFVDEKQRQLASHFVLPPNLFDEFVPSLVKVLTEQVDRLSNQLKEIGADHAARLNEINLLQARVQNLAGRFSTSDKLLPRFWNTVQRTGIFGGRIRHRAKGARAARKARTARLAKPG